MDNYSKLKAKWTNLIKKGEAGCKFDLELLTPGKFCVHISDCGGTPPCDSSIETTGFFDNAIDALAFYRFAEIPRILDWDTVTNKDPFPGDVESYLNEYDAEERDMISHLIGLIDGVITFGSVSKTELSSIRDEFNGFFSCTTPEVQILAWGSVYDTLSSDYFAEAFAEDIEEESEEDEKPSTMLKQLLDSGHFDEYNETHLSYAKDFFESHMNV